MINFFKVNFLLLIIHAQLEHDLEISGMSSCLSILSHDGNASTLMTVG